MKTMNTRSWLLCAALPAILASCSKSDSGPVATTCTITINDTLMIKPDSVRWDFYNQNPRVQAFTNSEATFTLWPASIASGNYVLDRQRVYWMYRTAIYTPGTVNGSLVLSNQNDVLSGSFSAQGARWSGTGPDNGKISATFTNVRKAGN